MRTKLEHVCKASNPLPFPLLLPRSQELLVPRHHHVHMQTHIWTRAHTCAYKAHTVTHACACMHSGICVHMHTAIHTCSQTGTHTHSYAHSHALTCVHSHTCPYSKGNTLSLTASTHTYTHTYACTYRHMHTCSPSTPDMSGSRLIPSTLGLNPLFLVSVRKPKLCIKSLTNMWHHIVEDWVLIILQKSLSVIYLIFVPH